MIPDRIEVNIAGGLDVALPNMVNVRQKFETERLVRHSGRHCRENFSAPRFAAASSLDRSSRSVAAAAASPTSPRSPSAVIRELQALGAQAVHLPLHGQPRRGNRRGPEESSGELRHHARPPPACRSRPAWKRPSSANSRRDAGAHGPARGRSRRHRRHQSHQAAYRVSRRRPKAGSPRCCRSASARSSAPRPTTPMAWTAFPSCCRRSAT